MNANDENKRKEKKKKKRARQMKDAAHKRRVDQQSMDGVKSRIKNQSQRTAANKSGK